MGGLARGADGALRYEVPEKGITIGEGLPGILVSASGRTPDEILGAAGALARDPDVDGIELRLDGLDMGRNSDEILTLCNLVNNAWEKAGGKLLIVTVRTKAEGGAASSSGASCGSPAWISSTSSRPTTRGLFQSLSEQRTARRSASS